MYIEADPKRVRVSFNLRSDFTLKKKRINKVNF